MTAHTMHNPFIHSVPPCKSLKSLFLRICYMEVVSIANWYYQKWVLIYFRSGHSMHSNLELWSHSKLSHKHVHNCVLGSYMKTFSYFANLDMQHLGWDINSPYIELHNSGCGLRTFQWKWLLLYQMAMIFLVTLPIINASHNLKAGIRLSWYFARKMNLLVTENAFTNRMARDMVTWKTYLLIVLVP